MKEEIEAATKFLTTLLSPTLNLDHFTKEFKTLLTCRYVNHWYLNDSERGSGYRAIVKNSTTLDSTLVSLVIKLTKVNESEVRDFILGGEKWILWVDPGLITFRMGGDYNEIKEIWSSTPTLSTPVKATLPLNPTIEDWLTNSPIARKSKAIQILHPESKLIKPTFNPTIIPPTPSVPQPPVHSFCSATPLTLLNLHTVKNVVPVEKEEPFLRPMSRSSSISSITNSETCSNHSSTTSQDSHLKSFRSVSPDFNLGTRKSGHSPSLSLSSTTSTNSTSSHPSRPSSAAGKTSKIVQEHLNGKVGVLGGGVLLGLPSTSNKENVEMGRRKRETSNVLNNNGRNRSRMRSGHSSISSIGSVGSSGSSAGGYYNGGYVSPVNDSIYQSNFLGLE